MANTNSSVGKKVEELMFRWYNLSTLRARVGQPSAVPSSKLDAEEVVLRGETEALVKELELGGMIWGVARVRERTESLMEIPRRV